MLDKLTDVPHNMVTDVYMTCYSVLDEHSETPYNAFDSAYASPDADYNVDCMCAMPVIHTPDELDLPLHEYIKTSTR